MNNSNRNEQIECLRGLAIIVVAVYHIFYRFQELYMSDIYLPLGKEVIHWFGSFGVLIFLNISVWFMIPLNDKKTILEIIKGKYVKLWGEYVIAVILIFGVVSYFPLPGRTVSIPTFLINLTMLEGFIPGVNYVDGSHWYLTTLLTTNLWVSVIEKICKNKPFGYLCWLGIALVSHLFPKNMMLVKIIITYDYVGVIVFIISVKAIIGNYKNKIKFDYGMLVLMVSGLMYMLVKNGIIYVFLMFLSIVLFIACLERNAPFLINRFLLFTGEISYIFYLIHQNIAYVVELKMLNASHHYSILVGVVTLFITYLGASGIFLIKYSVNRLIKSRGTKQNG